MPLYKLVRVILVNLYKLYQPMWCVLLLYFPLLMKNQDSYQLEPKDVSRVIAYFSFLEDIITSCVGFVECSKTRASKEDVE